MIYPTELDHSQFSETHLPLPTDHSPLNLVGMRVQQTHMFNYFLRSSAESLTMMNVTKHLVIPVRSHFFFCSMHWTERNRARRLRSALRLPSQWRLLVPGHLAASSSLHLSCFVFSKWFSMSLWRKHVPASSYLVTHEKGNGTWFSRRQIMIADLCSTFQSFTFLTHFANKLWAISLSLSLCKKKSVLRSRSPCGEFFRSEVVQFRWIPSIRLIF